MADAEPDWVRYARKVLRWYPEHTRWALAEIDAWDRARKLGADNVTRAVTNPAGIRNYGSGLDS